MELWQFLIITYVIRSSPGLVSAIVDNAACSSLIIIDKLYWYCDLVLKSIGRYSTLCLTLWTLCSASQTFVLVLSCYFCTFFILSLQKNIFGKYYCIRSSVIYGTAAPQFGKHCPTVCMLNYSANILATSSVLLVSVPLIFIAGIWGSE